MAIIPLMKEVQNRDMQQENTPHIVFILVFSYFHNMYFMAIIPLMKEVQNRDMQQENTPHSIIYLVLCVCLLLPAFFLNN